MFENDPNKRKIGTGFTNINRILKANVGAGQQMAGKIAQGVQTAGQNVQTQLGQSQQKFKEGFAQSTTPVLGSIAQAGGLVKQPGETDEQYANRIKNSQINYSEIGRQVSGAKYGGPSSIEDSNKLLGSAVSAGKLGLLSSSGLGQQQLVKQFVAGRQGYSKGQGALDQLLLSQSPEAQRQFQEARQSVSNIPQNIRESILSSAAQAQSAEKGIEEEKTKVLKDIQSSAIGIEERAKQQAQSYSNKAKRLAELLGDETLFGMAKGEKGTQYSGEQAEIDRQLLKNLKDFGIDVNATMYTSDKDNAIKQLKEIAQSGQTNVNTRYSDAQREALKRLSEFQQDQNKASQIAAQKNASAWNMSVDDFNKLASVQELENTRKQNLESVSDIGKYERALNLISGKDAVPPSSPPGVFSAASYINNWRKAASDVLGAETVKNIEDRINDEETGFLGISKSGKSYREGRMKSEAMRQINEILNPKYELRDRLNKQEQSKMSIQDFINKTYGV